ncbi:transcriptional regulator [Aurantiacibacter zhengii]|uniref:ArsR family transcriptional regulator n=1 Tax=Aurantiacibacter zhengii TaxID=2307003 RepID=A0A418NRR6_9SPHN|nr:transcriptional regulator [Aurantiacibacter zhengii]RIV85756.1 ArsR family transcriptional regulator [Aurantiacibacter zhengii]
MTAAIDPVLHPPARLQIAAALARVDDIEFATLREILDVSDSVLSKHLAAMADAGYVQLRKAKSEGRQRTWAAFTKAGAKAFKAHMAALQELAAAAQQAAAT